MRESKLWNEASTCVEHIHGLLIDLVEHYPDEKWTTAAKLRTAATDGMFFISKAIAGMTPEYNRYDWDQARRHFFAMQSLYLVAGKRKMLELDPEMVIKLDRLLKVITEACEKAKADAELQHDKELELWIKKYDLWQKIQK